MLLAAEHVDGGAEFEVEGGDAESGAEFAELFHRGEAFAGNIGERSVRRDEKVGVGTLGGAADAAAQLVEFGEAEAVGAVDQNGVGAGNVQTVLDYGCRDKDVRFVANEFQHHTFELFFGHLAVGYDHTRLGDQLLHHRAKRIDGFDAIVNEEELAVAGQLRFDGGLHQLFLEGSYDGLN